MPVFDLDADWPNCKMHHTTRFKKHVLALQDEVFVGDDNTHQQVCWGSGPNLNLNCRQVGKAGG